MTLAKKLFLSVTLLFSLLIIAFIALYFARVAIVKSITQEQLSLYQANISCLDFTIAKDLTLNIKKICLKTPQADIELNAVKVKFDLTAEQKIKHIAITSMSIDANAALLDTFKEQPKEKNPLSAAQQLNITLTKLSELQLPFTINVVKFNYSPFVSDMTKELNNQNNNTNQIKSKADNTIYSGNFSATQSAFQLALKDHQQSTVISTNIFELENKQFKAEIISQLAPLKRFILTHQLPLQATLIDTLELTTLEGDFQSDIHYEAGKLTVASQLNNLDIILTEGIKNSGPFTLNGSLNLQSQITLPTSNPLASNNQLTNKAAMLDFEFKKQNNLQLKFSPQHLLEYLKQQTFSNELITLLTDNPIEKIVLSPEGKLNYDLSNHKMSLSALTIAATNENQKHQLALNNIKVDIDHYFRIPQQSIANDIQNVTQLAFKLESPLVINALKNYSHLPVELALQGTFEQNQTASKLHLNKPSTVTSSNVFWLENKKTPNKKRLSINQVTTKIQGNIEISAPEQAPKYSRAHDQSNALSDTLSKAQGNSPKTNNKTNAKPAINVNLNLNTQAKKLRFEKTLEIKTLSLSTDIKGSVEDIKSTTAIFADNIPLGKLVVSGAVQRPKIALTAQQIPLTDLLALNIKLPTKVNLVAGTLSYSVMGQVDDLKNVQNTPFELTVDVSSVSGEISDIWVQELNWRQNFQLLNRELSTLNDFAKNTQKSLTVALIDTPTPISQLSINTSWHYQKEFKISATNLKGDVLGGSFAIPKIQWPLQHGHSVDVQLAHIDLAQVLELDKKQGIVVTGNISGQLPILFDGNKYTIKDGELHNVSDGLIQIINNPAVDKLKASNTQLQLAFDALQNLHYHQLSSDVSMADDGYMLLETVIKGRNPDIDNDVNLNLNLSYDLLGLLDSMSITKQFEERIIKGLQKN